MNSPHAPRTLPARTYQRDAVKGHVPHALVILLRHHVGQQCQRRGLPLPPDWPSAPGDERDRGAQVADHLKRFPVEEFCHLLIAAAEHLQDPLLGLHLGQTIRPAHLGALGYVLRACDCLGTALLRIERYHRLVHDLNPITHQWQDGHLALTWGISKGRPGALFDEMGLSGFVEFGRRLCAQPMPLMRVDFVNPPPPDARPYTDYFGCTVRFAQPATQLVLPASSLVLPLQQADPVLLALMESQVAQAMAELPQASDSLIDQTRRAVANLAPHGMPELPDVARHMGLSPRVLYRRLAAHGQGFRELRESALQHMAEVHLADLRLSLSEVGALLGYTEQSAFSRAFKRWTGLSPLQWRQTMAPR